MGKKKGPLLEIGEFFWKIFFERVWVRKKAHSWKSVNFFGKFWTENRGCSQTPPFMAVGRWVK